MIDKIRKIKYARMKPEERYSYDIFTNLVEYYHPSYPNKKYYKHNNELLFDYNLENGYFGCHYTKFWSILEKICSMSYEQIQSLVKCMVEEHLIKEDVTPDPDIYYNPERTEEQLIKKEVTLFIPVGSYFDIKGRNIIKKEVKPIGLPRLKETESEKDLIKKVIPDCEEWGEMDDVEKNLIKNNITPYRNIEGTNSDIEKKLIKKDITTGYYAEFHPVIEKYIIKKVTPIRRIDGINTSLKKELIKK